MKKLALLVIVLFLVSLTACGGSSASMPPPPPPPPSANASVTLSHGTAGGFDLAMSTSFQPAEWDYQFFQNFPNATTPLGNLQPHHIRLQGVSQGVPQRSATAWDFTILDAITQPVLGVGDNSPEFQIAVAPSFMYSNGNLDIQQFAGYTQNLVRYYNQGGFTSLDGQFHQSASNHPIMWWGIYNEPNIRSNNIADPSVYTNMYNTVVPAMQQIDLNIKFVGVELSGGYNNWEQIYFSTFVQNVTAPVDAVADHLYSSCNQRDTDAQVFSTVPGFAGDVQTIYSLLQTNAALANVSVWITENNVNADFNTGNGSACHPGQTFVTDQRGSSAFFTAWRPYVFSQVGQAGARALYHWDFAADAQFGELSDSVGQTRPSYWVDYWLGQMFPANSGQQVLKSTNSNSAQVEVLPVLNTDASVVVLISNHAVASASHNNGRGLPAKISVDVSALGPFTTASEVTIDSTTSPLAGPSALSISPHSPISVTLNGYGVAFVKLQ